MGNFYTNYTVRGPSQRAVASALAGRSALVTPAQDGCVVVFDESSEDQDHDAIGELAARLARQFLCPVLAVVNHDDDILWYRLYQSGALIDQYDSCPDYFDPEADPAGPSGGDAQKLCAAFAADGVAEVEVVLRKSGLDDDGYTFEVERHAELVRLLGLPAFAVGAGYHYVSQGEVPEGLTAEEIIRAPLV